MTRKNVVEKYSFTGSERMIGLVRLGEIGIICLSFFVTDMIRMQYLE